MTDDPIDPVADQAEILARSAPALREIADLLIGDPYAQPAADGFYAMFFAIRARGLFENFLHSLDSPAAFGPILACRPLVEIAIRAKWVSLSPTLHGELWSAQSDDRDLDSISGLEEFVGPEVHSGIPTAYKSEQIRKKTEKLEAARARAKAAGRKARHPVPDLRTVVNEIVKADAGHTEAIYQAYFGPYRSMSPWEHAEAGSFRAGIVESEAGRSFVGERSPMDTDSLKRIAGSMFAYVLEIAASAIQSDLGAVLRVIRDELTTPLVSPPATS